MSGVVCLDDGPYCETVGLQRTAGIQHREKMAVVNFMTMHCEPDTANIYAYENSFFSQFLSSLLSMFGLKPFCAFLWPLLGFMRCELPLRYGEWLPAEPGSLQRRGTRGILKAILVWLVLEYSAWVLALAFNRLINFKSTSMKITWDGYVPLIGSKESHLKITPQTTI